MRLQPTTQIITGVPQRLRDLGKLLQVGQSTLVVQTGAFDDPCKDSRKLLQEIVPQLLLALRFRDRDRPGDHNHTPPDSLSGITRPWMVVGVQDRGEARPKLEELTMEEPCRDEVLPSDRLHHGFVQPQIVWGLRDGDEPGTVQRCQIVPRPIRTLLNKQTQWTLCSVSAESIHDQTGVGTLSVGPSADKREELLLLGRSGCTVAGQPLQVIAHFRIRLNPLKEFLELIGPRRGVVDCTRALGNPLVRRCWKKIGRPEINDTVPYRQKKRIAVPNILRNVQPGLSQLERRIDSVQAAQLKGSLAESLDSAT